jgi:S-methylmethionine-dependent homocysteine/selenocysteine methylase
VISGAIGPHDDGYNPGELLTAEAAQDYHSTQIGTFADTAADMVAAITMTYADEANGIARAAAEAGLPAAISFTVETDGRLPSGQPLGEAIEQVEGDSGGSPSYYMINCAHPTQLDEAEELDEGDPADLGARYAGLREQLPRLNVLGGCCGTDHRHIAAIRDAWLAARSA